MDSAEKLKTYRVKRLEGTPESRSAEEDRILRRVFGDVDLDQAIMRRHEPVYDIAEDGTVYSIRTRDSGVVRVTLVYLVEKSGTSLFAIAGRSSIPTCASNI